MMCQGPWYLLCQATKTEGKQVRTIPHCDINVFGGEEKINFVTEIREVTCRIHLQIYNTIELSMNWLFEHFWNIPAQASCSSCKEDCASQSLRCQALPH